MKKKSYLIKIVISGTLLVVASFLWACGGGESASSTSEGLPSSDSSTGPAVATMPPARFNSVSSQVFTNTSTTTPTTQTTTTTATNTSTETQSVVAVAPDLDRGARAYAKNKCAECHGERGEGVSGKGNAIASTTLTLDEFEDILRTGGDLGNSHIFGTSAVSPSGMEILYLYVQSLVD